MLKKKKKVIIFLHISEISWAIKLNGLLLPDTRIVSREMEAFPIYIRKQKNQKNIKPGKYKQQKLFVSYR